MGYFFKPIYFRSIVLDGVLSGFLVLSIFCCLESQAAYPLQVQEKKLPPQKEKPVQNISQILGDYLSGFDKIAEKSPACKKLSEDILRAINNLTSSSEATTPAELLSLAVYIEKVPDLIEKIKKIEKTLNAIEELEKMKAQKQAQNTSCFSSISETMGSVCDGIKHSVSVVWGFLLGEETRFDDVCKAPVISVRIGEQGTRKEKFYKEDKERLEKELAEVSRELKNYGIKGPDFSAALLAFLGDHKELLIEVISFMGNKLNQLGSNLFVNLNQNDPKAFVSALIEQLPQWLSRAFPKNPSVRDLLSLTEVALTLPNQGQAIFPFLILLSALKMEKGSEKENSVLSEIINWCLYKDGHEKNDKAPVLVLNDENKQSNDKDSEKKKQNITKINIPNPLSYFSSASKEIEISIDQSKANPQTPPSLADNSNKDQPAKVSAEISSTAPSTPQRSGESDFPQAPSPFGDLTDQMNENLKAAKAVMRVGSSSAEQNVALDTNVFNPLSFSSSITNNSGHSQAVSLTQPHPQLSETQNKTDLLEKQRLEKELLEKELEDQKQKTLEEKKQKELAIKNAEKQRIEKEKEYSLRLWEQDEQNKQNLMDQKNRYRKDIAELENKHQRELAEAKNSKTETAQLFPDSTSPISNIAPAQEGVSQSPTTDLSQKEEAAQNPTDTLSKEIRDKIKEIANREKSIREKPNRSPAQLSNGLGNPIKPNEGSDGSQTALSNSPGNTPGNTEDKQLLSRVKNIVRFLEGKSNL